MRTIGLGGRAISGVEWSSVGAIGSGAAASGVVGTSTGRDVLSAAEILGVAQHSIAGEYPEVVRAEFARGSMVIKLSVAMTPRNSKTRKWRSVSRNLRRHSTSAC